METNVEAVNLGHFEMLQSKEKTSLTLFIWSKLFEVRIVFRCVMKIPHCIKYMLDLESYLYPFSS